MSNYTSIFIYPVDEKFHPSEPTLYNILEFFRVDRIEIAAGSNPSSDDDEEEDENDVFILKNTSLLEALENAHKFRPKNIHLMFPHEGNLYSISQSLERVMNF